MFKADKDFYKTLGINSKATSDEIKTAYRKMARKYHPDVSSDANAEVKFRNITEAYETLSDVKKREEYDNSQSSQGFKSSSFKDTFSQPSDYSTENANDLLRMFKEEFDKAKYADLKMTEFLRETSTSRNPNSDSFSSVFSDVKETSKEKFSKGKDSAFEAVNKLRKKFL